MISATPRYKWRAKYGGMDASPIARMKELEDENRRLKMMIPQKGCDVMALSELMWW